MSTFPFILLIPLSYILLCVFCLSKVCDALDAPLNGNVTISPNFTTATFTCDLGFSINDVAARVCSDAGTGWSDSTPHCGKNKQPRLMYLFCLKICACSSTSVPSNSKFDRLLE